MKEFDRVIFNLLIMQFWFDGPTEPDEYTYNLLLSHMSVKALFRAFPEGEKIGYAGVSYIKEER